MKSREPPSPGLGPELVPLDPEEFSQVFALAMKAAEREWPATMQDGSASDYLISELPFWVAMGPAMEHYTADADEAISAMVRMTELVQLARSGALGQWVRPNPDKPESQLHPAVIEAAATTRLTPATKFPLPEFLGEVHRIASEKYPEGDAW